MKLKLTIFLLALISCGFLSAAQKNLDEYIEKVMKDWEVPGLAIAIIKDDKIILAKGYGYLEIGKPERVNTETIFAIGSCSKAFTAAAIAMLVDEGKVKWDDPVRIFLPNFQLFDPFAAKEVTVRDLLSHRTSLERCDLLWYGTSFDRQDLLRRMRYLKPDSSFRSRWRYQNMMFLAAGEIIPSVTDKSWDLFVQERLFSPLGMHRSFTSVTTLTDAQNLAKPHVKINERIEAIAYRNLDNIGPSGSINSTIADMAQWVKLQLGSGKYKGSELISSPSCNEMHEPQAVIPHFLNDLLQPQIHFNTYGLGWEVQDFRGYKMVEHDGHIDGMSALVSMLPEKKLGIAILSNRGESVATYAIAYHIFDSYLKQAPERDWSSDFLRFMAKGQKQSQEASKKLAEERIKETHPSLPLNHYVGTFHNDLWGDLSITQENEGLKCRFLAYDDTMDHWHFDTFSFHSVKDTPGAPTLFFFTFAISPEGKVDKIQVQATGAIDALFTRAMEE